MRERLLFAKLCGAPTVEWSDGAAINFPTKRGLALFAYLALRSGEPVSREELADLLWPDRDPSSARRALRGTIYEVRKALGSEADAVLAVHRNFLTVDAGMIDSDVARKPAPSEALEFFSGIELGSPSFDDWVTETRLRLSESAREGALGAAESSLAEGNGQRALEIAKELVGLDSLDEASHRLSMRAKVALGRRSDALREYDELCLLLRHELDSQPSEQTTVLSEHIQRGERFLPREKLQRPALPSIAVMPFVNRTGEERQAHIVDSLFEAIASELSRDRSLFVISTASTSHYRALPVRPAEVAGELGVRYLVEGRVRMDTLRMRLDVQLLDGVRGAVVWNRSYDCARPEILAVQDDIVSQIVATLRGYKGVIQRSELRRSRTKPDIDLTSYDLLMQGMALKERFIKEDMRAARALFERAISISPSMAAAHGWLAWTWFFEVYMGWTDRPDFALAETFRAAQTAVELDPDLDFGHWAIGAAHLAAGENEKALSRFERALELNPNNSDAMANMAWPLVFTGRTGEALEKLRQAMRLNPFFPDWYLWGSGMALYAQGDCTEAARELAKMNQSNDQSLAFMIAALVEAGEVDAAEVSRNDLLSLAPKFEVSRCIEALPFSDTSVVDRLRGSLHAVGLT